MFDRGVEYLSNLNRHVTSYGWQPGPAGMNAYWAKCRCGWSGPTRGTRDEAVHDSREHEKENRDAS